MQKKILALLLIALMAFSFGACKGGQESSSAESASAAESGGADETGSAGETSEEAQESGTSEVQTASGSSKTETPNNSTSKPAADSKKNVFAADPYSEIPASLKNSTVKVLMWQKVWDEEKKVAEAFTKKTGIKVEFISTTVEQYTTKLASMISAKDAPDTFMMGSDRKAANYMSVSTKMAQKLDPKVFRLDDPIWGKDDMNMLQIKKGRYYGVNIPGSWMSSDTIYALFYNKTLLNNLGITETPADLYKAGKWNWDTFEKMAREIKAEGVLPCSFLYEKIWMLSAGVDFVGFENDRFVNNVSNAAKNKTLNDAWKFTAKLNAEGLAKMEYTDQFVNRQSAMMVGILYGARKDSGWGLDKMGKDVIEIAPIPSPKGMATVAPQDIKVWGLAQGAKNPEGTAFFLRYWLDPKNYNMDSVFINSNMKTAFNDMVKMKKSVMLSEGVVGYSNSKAILDLQFKLMTGTPDGVNTLLKSEEKIIKSGVDKANAAIGSLK